MSDWYKDIEIQPEMLDEDYRLIAQRIGMDNLFELLKLFDKSSVYFSYERMDKARRLYITKYVGSKGIKEVARILGVSERYVYKVLHDDITTTDNQIKIEF